MGAYYPRQSRNTENSGIKIDTSLRSAMDDHFCSCHYNYSLLVQDNKTTVEAAVGNATTTLKALNNASTGFATML